MNFLPGHIEKIKQGKKTETRRIVQPYHAWGEDHRAIISTNTGKLLYERGKNYSMCPGRGKPKEGMIWLWDIAKEKLQEITEDGALKEGVVVEDLKGCYYHILERCLVDPVVSGLTIGQCEKFRWLIGGLRGAYAMLWDSINHKGSRWVDNPEVWVFKFEYMIGDV